MHEGQELVGDVEDTDFCCTRRPKLSPLLPPQVDDELEIKAYYAGHVLGAAMFQIKVGSESVVYTVSGGACSLAGLPRVGRPFSLLPSLPG